MKLQQTIKNIATSSILIALIFITTFLLKIPYGGGMGYFNFSDGLIIFFSITFNPFISITSSIIGTTLSDLASGYIEFILPTIVAKGLESLFVYLLFRFFKENKYLKYLIFIIPPLIMVLVYFISYLILFNINFSYLSSIFDLIQGFIGVIISISLVTVFSHTNFKIFKEKLKYF